MNRVFPLPLFTFWKMIVKNGGLSIRGLKNSPPWFLKTILFEPLRWLELAFYNKKIQQHQITEHPVFILGFYRSGTSYLHECLSKDDRLGYHSNFQMVLPEIMLSTEKFFLPVFEFICKVFRLKDSVHRVPLSFKFPGEEDATMTTYLDPKGAQWGYFFPKMMDEQFQKYVMFEGLSEEEISSWKHSFLYLLKKISIANHGKRLVLKSPPNTARIKLLLSMFPKAKFVFIHRNPFEVYASNKRFWGVVQRKYALQGSKGLDVNNLILSTYSKMMHKYLEEKSLVPEGQLAEVVYDDFVQKPVESLRKVYRDIQLGDFDHVEERLRNFTSSRKSFIQLKHALPEDERRVVAEKLDPLLKYWNCFPSN